MHIQDDIIITPFTPYYVCICAAFSVEGEHDQIIVTGFDPENPDVEFRGIFSTNNEVRIWGATTDSKYVPIIHESKKSSWTTVWVEWKIFCDCRSLFYINDAEVQGVFSSQGTPPIQESGISIGGRFDGSRSLRGSISALEIYGGSNSRLPDVIRNLMISSQIIKREVKEEDPPPPPHPSRKRK